MFPTKSLILLLAILSLFPAVVYGNDFQYVSPKPGSEFTPLNSAIVIRDGNINFDLSQDIVIELTSENNEIVKGELAISKDKSTLNFNPVVSLKPDTRYSARLIRNGIEEIEFTFKTVRSALQKTNNFLDSYKSILMDSKEQKDTEKIIGNPEQAVPDGIPEFEVVKSVDPSDGYYFITPFTIPFFNRYLDIMPSIAILDNYGTPVYFKRLQIPEDSTQATTYFDFKMMEDGTYAYADAFYREYVALNDHMERIGTYRMVNDILMDFHDMQLMENGNRLMISYTGSVIDLSEYMEGASDSIWVTWAVIQEIDKDDNLLLQWNSMDYITPDKGSDELVYDLEPAGIDYFHINSIDADTDTSLIWSARHLNAVGKIHRQTGDLIWALGSEKVNDFEFTSSVEGEKPEFHAQHDFRKQEDGTWTLFDNIYEDEEGNLTSRGCIYELDEENLTANLIQVLRNEPNSYSVIMSNVQKLENGNYVLSWATGRPNITEFSNDGEVLHEIDFPAYTYRAFKFDYSHDLFVTDIKTMEFDTVTTDTFSIKRVGITNNMKVTIEIDEVLSHNPDIFKSVTKLPILIEPDSTKYIDIAFTPDNAGYFEDVLTICRDNVLERHSQQVKISGYGDVVSNVNESVFIEKFNIYPNPANDIINIGLPSLSGKKVEIRICDINGNIIMKEFVRDPKNQITLNISEVPVGVYYMQLNSGRSRETLMFSIIR